MGFRRALRPKWSARLGLGAAVGLMTALLPGATENAVANGDTRTITLYHVHTHESITATYLVNGSYDSAVLDKLNWFLRDWRRDEPTKMDPKLFDVVWEVYRESGSHQPVEVMSAYRSPETNAMLRRRSRQVAEHSQHILGKAMDQHYFDVPMSKIREIAMRLQRGGVGFYPTAGTPFVHMDVGGVRHWPRMSYDQLARLFPDGKTVHIPSNGQPLPGYEEARAELEARGGEAYPTASEIKSKGFFAWLFGSSDEEEDQEAAGNARSAPPTAAPRNQRVAMVDRSGALPYSGSSKDGGMHGFLAAQQPAPAAAPSVYGRVARDAPAPVAPPPQPAPEPVPATPPQATLALAMSMENRGAAEETAVPPPAAAPSPAAVSAAPASAVPNLTVPPQALAANGLSVPLPPRRPTELAELDASPLPPVRPPEFGRAIEAPAPTPGPAAHLARADGINALLAAADHGSRGGLPSVITQGASNAKAPPLPPTLAYAGASSLGSGRSAGLQPADVPLPVARPADLVLARLDRGNFRALTSVAKTSASVSRTGLGSGVVGIRAASRANLGTFGSAAGSATNFGSKISDLSTDAFSGQAVKGTERLVTAKRAEATN